MSSLTIYFENQKQNFTINLSKENASKTFKKANNKQTGNVPLFNFNGGEVKAKSADEFRDLCTMLKKLARLGGNKDTIDDADFKIASNTEGCVTDFSGKHPEIETTVKSIWHAEPGDEEGAPTYHTKAGETYFITAYNF